MTQPDWVAAVEAQREQKEAFFREHPRSPIPPDQRGESFPGLEHFPVDPAYRFELELSAHGERDEVTVETTVGGEQAYVRWGEFRVTLEGTDLALQAYRPASGEDRFWVPFRDETNDEETYGAGRYIDLEPGADQLEDGRWVLDLNRAYNPTCAYNPAYECPLIPMENWLEVRVEAGEKAYPLEPPHQGHEH